MHLNIPNGAKKHMEIWVKAIPDQPIDVYTFSDLPLERQIDLVAQVAGLGIANVLVKEDNLTMDEVVDAFMSRVKTVIAGTIDLEDDTEKFNPQNN